MTIGKIALGVFLGNLAFALLAWLVLATVFDAGRSAALVDQAHSDYRAMNERNAAGGAPRQP